MLDQYDRYWEDVYDTERDLFAWELSRAFIDNKNPEDAIEQVIKQHPDGNMDAEAVKLLESMWLAIGYYCEHLADMKPARPNVK